MAIPPEGCLTDSGIRTFLESPSQQADFEDHVNECRRCQQRIQELSESSADGWKKFMPDDHSISFEQTLADNVLLCPPAQDVWQQGCDRIGRFEDCRPIGKGAMGVVYVATDPKLGRNVAIKLLTEERVSDAVWMERFGREARLAGSLNHPNVLTIYEIGESEGRPYIASELVQGVTLQERLLAFRLQLSEVLDYAAQLADGLAAAHAAGIVHRDLKPDNVMIRDDGLIKILDFGLARFSGQLNLEEASVSRDGMIVGTVSFMSPEQARGQELDVSSDLFSFGSLLFLMLSGQRPFVGETPSDVMAAILTRAPQSMGEFNTDVPPWLVQLVARCLSKDPALRPTSAEVVADLAQHWPAPPVLKTEQKATAPEVDRRAFDEAPIELTDVRYARSGDVNIAWQTVGDGPIDMVFVMGWVSHLEWFWKDANFAAFLRRLASFSRVILFDKRGTGLSDRVPVDELPTLEKRMDDVRAVMAAAKSEHAVLCGISEGGPLCALFAATYPQKTIALTMMGSYARRMWAKDYPWGPTEAQRELFFEEIANDWGGPLGIEDRAPSKANDPEFRKWWASYLRMGASPGAAVALTRMNAQIDVRPILPTIQVPTLVLHRTGDRCLRVAEGRHVAELIPGAKFVELPGDDHLPFVGDSEAILDHLERFLTGMKQSPAVDQVLATVLYLRIEADSAAAFDQFQQLLHHKCELFRGDHLTIVDGAAKVMFDGPARAVRAAHAIVGLANRLSIGVSCALDTGICDVGQETLGGTAVELALQISQSAEVAEVLVTNTVRNLVSGSGLLFIPKFTLSDPDIEVFSLVESS
ncbi:MAG: alpha/beta fold hydrolase [Fuerstiella sp.]